MARKTRTEAEAETQRAHEARLQYLSRNPEFQRDIDCLMTLNDAVPGKPGDDLAGGRLEAIQKLIPALQVLGVNYM